MWELIAFIAVLLLLAWVFTSPGPSYFHERPLPTTKPPTHRQVKEK